MRQSIVRVWRLQPSADTDVSGDVNGSVQSGNFNGPIGQGGNVTINFPPNARRIRGRRPRRQPRTVRQYVNAMWSLMLEGDRQSLRWRHTANIWLMCLTIYALISLIGWVAVVAQFLARFGWLW